MTLLLSADISNWDSPSVENNVGCLSQAFTGPPVIRASTENPRLAEIAINQIDAFENQGRSTMGYDWAYGSQRPEANAQATVSLVDGHCSIKRLWLDVEDYGNFAKNSANLFVPRRMLATLAANDMTPSVLDLGRMLYASKAASPLFKPFYNANRAITLAGLPAIEAVAWIRAWVNEVRTLGYTPGIYSAPGVWADLCLNNTSFGDVDGWGAAWGIAPTSTPPLAWGGITNWVGVQYLAGGSDAVVCGHSLDLDAWDSDKLGVVTTPPNPPDVPPTDGTDGKVSQADFERLNNVLVWRLNGLRSALQTADQYLDTSNVPEDLK